ncbi:TM2 domain-containing protein [Corynebacterium camporealensis]
MTNPENYGNSQPYGSDDSLSNDWNSSYQGNQQGGSPFQQNQQPYPQYQQNPQNQQAMQPYQQQGQQQYQQQNYGNAQQKSWIAALLLCFFLGSWGVHNFYLGNTTKGVVQLVMWILGMLTVWFIVGALLLFPLYIWVIVEFIMLIVGANGYDRDARGIPLSR